MSVLEFIAALKWPVVVLVALAVVSRGFKRNPDMGQWFRGWLDSRDVRGKIGPTEFEATTSRAQEAAQVAAASDGQLASLAQVQSRPGEPPEGDPEDVAAIRRDAVEAVMRDSARWGWELARIGIRTPPTPQITWSVDGEPEIFFDVGHGLVMPRAGVAVVAREIEERDKRAARQEAISRRLRDVSARQDGNNESGDPGRAAHP